TTAAAIERLKANIATLAIELGDALLPHINKVVDFLTSPEGKEWGRSAVAKAKDVVVGFADAVMTAGRLLNDLINTFGGATTAVGLLGAAVFALTGPFSAAIAAAVAFGAAAGKALDAVLNRAQKMELALARLRNEADAIRNKEAQDELDEARREGDQTSLEIRQKKQAFDAAEAWYEREKKKRGGDKDGALLKRRNAMEAALLSGRYQPGTTFDERLAAFGAEPSDLPGLMAARSSVTGKVSLAGLSQEQKERM